MPVMVTGPVAVRVNAVSSAVPPSSLTTVLSKVNFGLSLLLIVQLALWPLVRVRFAPESVPAVQLHALAV